MKKYEPKQMVVSSRYINRKDKIGKWLMGTVGFAILCAILSGFMALILR